MISILTDTINNNKDNWKWDFLNISITKEGIEDNVDEKK